MMRLVLDTSILSKVMRQDGEALSKARAYLYSHGVFTLSVITVYEVLRGLRAKGATRQMDYFNDLCKASSILLISEEVAQRAAEIHADLRMRGEPIGDADILIAACALVENCGVATNNTKHFEKIDGLHLEDW